MLSTAGVAMNMRGGVGGTKALGTFARVLLLVLLIMVYIHNQWSRQSIVYAVNFAAQPSPAAAREFMNIDIGFDASQFGVMASFGFTFLYTMFSLVAGRVADIAHKGRTLAVACGTWSTALILQSLCTNYYAALVCRVVQGIAMAFTGPQALSLLADAFAANRLATATSLYTSGVYFGAALASLSILANSHLGWRASFRLLGGGGCLLAMIVALTVADRRASARSDDEGDGHQLLATTPTDDSPDDNDGTQPGGESAAGSLLRLLTDSIASMGKVVATKEVQWALAAGGVRFCAGYGVSTWTAALFRARFPEAQSSYAGLNALILAAGGFASSVAGGVLSDRFGGHRARLLVPAAGCFLAIPAAVMSATAGSFSTAMVFLGLVYLVGECWIGPFVSFLTSTVPSDVRGSAQGMVSMLTLIGNLAPLTIGFLYGKAGVPLGVAYLGCICTSYLCAGSLFVVSALKLDPLRAESPPEPVSPAPSEPAAR